MAPPLSINLEAPVMMRAVLRQILETGDVVGRDPSGRVLITLAVDEWLLEKFAAFDVGAEVVLLSPAAGFRFHSIWHISRCSKDVNLEAGHTAPPEAAPAGRCRKIARGNRIVPVKQPPRVSRTGALGISGR